MKQLPAGRLFRKVEALIVSDSQSKVPRSHIDEADAT